MDVQGAEPAYGEGEDEGRSGSLGSRREGLAAMGASDLESEAEELIEHAGRVLDAATASEHATPAADAAKAAIPATNYCGRTHKDKDPTDFLALSARYGRHWRRLSI